MAIARIRKPADETPKPRRAATRAGAPKPKEAPAKTRSAAAKPKPVASPKATAKPGAATTPRAPVKAPMRAVKAGGAKPAPPRPARAPRAPRRKVEPALLDRLVAAARSSLEDDKAENVTILDVTGRADYADRLVIATGLADRQIQAMATHLEEAFEKEGLKLRRDAIQASPDWVLIDCGDLVVHLFKPEARALYALERMWGPDSPAAQGQEDRTPLPDDGAGGSTAEEEEEEDA